MRLKIFRTAVFFMVLPFFYADTCQPVYSYENQLLYISHDEFKQILKNYNSCAEGWLNWECCKCHYLNGYAFNTCQFCGRRKCE